MKEEASPEKRVAGMDLENEEDENRESYSLGVRRRLFLEEQMVAEVLCLGDKVS